MKGWVCVCEEGGYLATLDRCLELYEEHRPQSGPVSSPQQPVPVPVPVEAKRLAAHICVGHPLNVSLNFRDLRKHLCSTLVFLRLRPRLPTGSL